MYINNSFKKNEFEIKIKILYSVNFLNVLFMPYTVSW